MCGVQQGEEGEVLTS